MFQLIYDILILVFLAIIAASCIVFPTIYLVQKKNQHDEIIRYLRNRS